MNRPKGIKVKFLEEADKEAKKDIKKYRGKQLTEDGKAFLQKLKESGKNK